MTSNRAVSGKGGDASVAGNESHAFGGDAGETVAEPGGDGGEARVVGHLSTAIGGRGGRGGIFAGMPGGDAYVIGDNTLYAGGQGGEAAQADGRGGRGGRAFNSPGRRSHMKLPYGYPNLEPGRGGDAADTVQYRARRIIVESLKGDYYAQHRIDIFGDQHAIWYDRSVVPLAWINKQLAKDGHCWSTAVVDLEYEFTDL